MSGTSTLGSSGGTAGVAATLGIVDLYWQGNLLTIKDGTKLTLGGMKNKPVKSTRDVFNAQMFVESEINAEVLVQPGMTVTQVFGTSTGELQAKCDTGQLFVWSNAFVSGAPQLTAKADGGLQVKFSAGAPVET